jgi:hypothetical protein
MSPELAGMVAIFWIGRKPGCEVSMVSTAANPAPGLAVGYGGAVTIAPQPPARTVRRFARQRVETEVLLTSAGRPRAVNRHLGPT